MKLSIGRRRIRDASHFLAEMSRATGSDPGALRTVTWSGDDALPSCFAVTDFASAAIAAAGLASAHLVAEMFDVEPPPVNVDRRLASRWFQRSIEPIGWTIPETWDSIAGNYLAADGWIRLHTNAPRHRAAALAVLACAAEKTHVSVAVRTWNVNALETAIVAAGGCAAGMRSVDDWSIHPQGAAASKEPLVGWTAFMAATHTRWLGSPARPLHGVRVLDLTRVLAGPVATRFLAGLGAEVLRLDPPGWEEPAVVAEVTLGKRCARLDLRDTHQKERFVDLLAQADIIVHGYRPSALDDLGFDAATRRAIAPGLIDVTLNAYGWSGPWSGRRGFDSLVQMSCGIAHAGMLWKRSDRPVPLPVQALDHATGYLMAACAIDALRRRLRTGSGSQARVSLARVAASLIADPHANSTVSDTRAPGREVYDRLTESTPWGAAARLHPPLTISGTPLRWEYPASQLGSAAPIWR